REIERRRHLALIRTVPHQRDVAARAERKRKCIEQDRLASTGLAGERGKALGEIDIEPLDQNDVTDGQPGQHEQAMEDGRWRTDEPRLSVILPLSSAPVVRLTSAAASREPSEGPADPGALVLGRLKPALVQQRKGVLVPATVREIVAEHGRRSLRL